LPVIRVRRTSTSFSSKGERRGRLRVGDYRVIFRALSPVELRSLGARERTGVLVERLIHRRDLERAMKAL